MTPTNRRLENFWVNLNFTSHIVLNTYDPVYPHMVLNHGFFKTLWCGCVWCVMCVCSIYVTHKKCSCHTVTCDTKKPKVSSLREKSKVSRVHRDHMGVTLNFISRKHERAHIIKLSVTHWSRCSREAFGSLASSKPSVSQNLWFVCVTCPCLTPKYFCVT